MDKDQIQQNLAQAQKMLMQGNLDGAQRIITDVLKEEADNKAALYIQAVLYRYNQKLDKAESTLGTLLTQSPEFGRAHQELGYVFKSKGELKDAIIAFQQAVKANPALTGAWHELVQLFKTVNNQPEALKAEQQLLRLQSLPKELLAVINYLHEDKLVKAEKLCRAFLKVNPTHTEAMRLLADIASRFGVLNEAEFLLENAINFAPNEIQLRLDYIQVLRKAQKFEIAYKASKDLLETDPENPVFLSHYAIQAMQAGDYSESLTYFDKVLTKLPADAATHTSKGHALKTLGHQEKAIESYKQAISHAPEYGDAWYGLANLKTYSFNGEEIALMQKQVEQKAISVAAKTQIYFSLGKVFEDQKDYGKSFDNYTAGNALRHAESRYDADGMDKELQAQKAICTPALIKNTKGQGCEAIDPIFIVGLPRAGSTLIEQILASHSMVDGTMELPNILMIAQELRQRKTVDAEDGYPNILNQLDADQLRALGERYLAETKQHRGNAQFFTDKMPNNFRHIPLIKLILPNAKIIDARRDPMACCFSGFKQLFAEGQEFTYSLSSMGRYYRGYVDLMDYYDQVMPEAIHRVIYENMVADSETEIRKLLDYCGLPFEEACLDFHKTERAVKTASSEQVRQKINTKGLEAWKPFEDYLGPLKEALGPLAP